MNNGAFGENFPYSNFHDLNMDWIIKIAKDFLDQYTNIQNTITTGLNDLDTKAETLQTLLQTWYDTHSEDIANQLADALEAISTALNTANSAFAQRAYEKAEEVINTIPEDYTALSNLATVTNKQVLQNTGSLIPYTYNLPTNEFTLGQIDTNTGEIQESNIRAYSILLPMHKGQVIRNIDPVTYKYRLLRYDAMGNYIDSPEWCDELCYIDNNYSYRILVGKTNNGVLTNLVDTLDSNFIIYDLSPSLQEELEYSILEDIHIDSSSIVQGRFYYTVPEYSATRIRPKNIYRVRKGDMIGCFPNGMEIKIEVYSETGEQHVLQDWYGAFTNIVSDYSGYIAINIRKPDQSNVTPTDFAGYINITRKKDTTLVVDINGNGDFTSFSRAVIVGYNIPNCTIIVKPGAYNIFDELETMFGQGYFDNLQSTYYLALGLPWGNGMHIIGNPGAALHFDGTRTSNTQIHEYFSILFSRHTNNMATMNIVEGLTFIVSKCKYCIHLDEGAVQDDSTYIIRHCQLVINNSQNTVPLSAVIGMGASINTTYIIESNYIVSVFNSIARDKESLYYHNTNANLPANKLIVKDNYILNDGTIRVDEYGDSHQRCVVQISGNSVGSPMILGGLDNDQFRYLVWNNEVRT